MKLELSFKEAIETVGMPLVRLLVNGHEGYFLVDTGANVSIIDEKFAKEVEAVETETTLSATTSIGGDTPVKRSYLVSFTIGGTCISDIPCAESDLSSANDFLGDSGYRLDGLLGMNVMIPLHAVVDVAGCTLAFNLPGIGKTEEQTDKNN